jgi:thiamine biosynthesis lipoprotein
MLIMKRRTFFMCLAGTAAAGMTGWSLKSANRPGPFRGSMARVSRHSYALGANVNLTVFHPDKSLANRAIDAALQELDRIESVMSLYRPSSQISRLNEQGRLANPDPALLEVLALAKSLSEKTQGAFDITVQPLWKVYFEQARSGGLPNQKDVEAALAKVDWRRVRIGDGRVDLDGAGTQITLNGIAQGYAADAVARILRSHGIESALIDTGEINTVGHHVEKADWTVGIKHPRTPQDFIALASLSGRCLATSGDYETRFTEDFKNHHLLDPKTGHSPAEFASVSIAAPTALEADGYSTAVFMLGLKAGRELVETTPGLDALFVTKEGRMERTSGFPS